MRTTSVFVLTALLVLLAPQASAGQYHYTQTTTDGQTVLGTITIIVAGDPLVGLPADTLGHQSVYVMESDADCVAKYNTRTVEETLSGAISGSKAQESVNLVWEWSGLVFIGRGESISYSPGTIHVNTGVSPFAGTTALEALQQIIEASKRPDAQINNPTLLESIRADLVDDLTNYQTSDIAAAFNGDGPGTQIQPKKIDWGCPGEL